MHYAIGDVHGYFQDLILLIQKIENIDPDARFILLGDLIDRGSESLEVLEWAMNHITPGGKYQSVRGNHEDLVLQWYQYRFLPWEKKNREKDPSLRDPLPKSKFDFSTIVENAGLIRSEQLRPIMEFLDSLPFSLELKTEAVCTDSPERGLSDAPIQGTVTYRLVHGWYREQVTVKRLQEHINLRGRVFTGNPGSSFIIVHGHTPTCNPEYIAADPIHTRPGSISYRDHAINLDGGRAEDTWNGQPCMLCGICLETLEEYYVHLNRDNTR